MDLNAILDQVLVFLGTINPVLAAVGAAVVFFLRQRGYLRIPGVEPKTPADPLDGSPLLQRLRDRLRDRLKILVQEGYEEEDAFTFLLDKIREDPEDENDDAV